MASSAPFTYRGIVLPQDVRESLDFYATHRVMPGGFLYAVLSHDLFNAVWRADPKNLAALPAIVAYVYNELPPLSHGNAGMVDEWVCRK